MKKRQVKDRENYPYIVFQVDRDLKERLEKKIEKLKKQNKPNASMSAFVENLVRRAV